MSLLRLPFADGHHAEKSRRCPQIRQLNVSYLREYRAEGSRVMLTRWDPFSEMSRLQDEVNTWLTPATRSFAWTPAVDIYEDKESIFVHVETPGMTADQININVENNVLTLKGERKLERAERRESYHRVERAYGTFSRSFVLPNLVDSEKILAEMKDGVLTVRLPKKSEAQARRIEVKHA